MITTPNTMQEFWVAQFPNGEFGKVIYRSARECTAAAVTGIKFVPVQLTPATITIEQAYEKGWAKRDDLIADIDSQAYENERDAALAAQVSAPHETLDAAIDAAITAME